MRRKLSEILQRIVENITRLARPDEREAEGLEIERRAGGFLLNVKIV